MIECLDGVGCWGVVVCFVGLEVVVEVVGCGFVVVGINDGVRRLSVVVVVFLYLEFLSECFLKEFVSVEC